MKEDIKLVFFDIDGTLVNAAGVISPRVTQSIHALIEKGVRCSLATGRPLFSAQWVIDELSINAPCMFSSGAMIYDPVSKQALHTWSVDAQQSKVLIDEAKDLGLYTELYSTDTYFSEVWKAQSEIHFFYLKQKPVITPFADVIERTPLLKVLFIAMNLEEEKKLRSLIAAHPEFHWGVATGASHPGVVFANATNPSGTRDWAFDYITSKVSIGADSVMAFGDGESDAIFLQRAKIGVAMENGASTLKAKAKHICPSVEADGIAVFLESFLK